MHLDPVTLGQVADGATVFFNVTLGIAVFVVACVFWWQSVRRPGQTVPVSRYPNRWLATRVRRLVLAELRAAEGSTVTVQQLVDALGTKLVLLVVRSMGHRIPNTELRLDLNVGESGGLEVTIVGREADEQGASQ